MTQLNQVINKVSEMPDIKGKMTEQWLTVTVDTPARFREFTAEQLARSQEIAKLLEAK